MPLAFRACRSCLPYKRISEIACWSNCWIEEGMLSREVDELSMVLNYFQLCCTLVTGAQVKRKYVSDYLHCPFPVCKVPVELVEAGISMLFDCSIFNTNTLNIIYARKIWSQHAIRDASCHSHFCSSCVIVCYRVSLHSSNGGSATGETFRKRRTFMRTQTLVLKHVYTHAICQLFQISHALQEPRRRVGGRLISSDISISTI